MGNLRALAEKDLAITLEGQDWATDVRLIPPDGVPFSARGQVLYNLARNDADTGERISVNTPVVTLRRSSLRRVPEPGENWIVEAPEGPRADAAVVQFVFSGVRPPEGGASIGFIRLYLQRVEQSED